MSAIMYLLILWCIAGCGYSLLLGFRGRSVLVADPLETGLLAVLLSFSWCLFLLQMNAWAHSPTPMIIGLVVALLLAVMGLIRGESFNIFFRKSYPYMAAAMLLLLLVHPLTPAINILSDGWWHMAKARSFQDAVYGGYELREHIGGGYSSVDLLDSKFLWYQLLAFWAQVSDTNLVSVFSASGRIVLLATLFAYAGLAWVLFESKWKVILALAIFLIWIGGLNSGARLMAWPAGIGYTLLYLALAMAVRLCTEMAANIGSSGNNHNQYIDAISRCWKGLMVVGWALVLMWWVHEAEIFLFLMFFLFYWMAVGLVPQSSDFVSADFRLLLLPAILVLLAFGYRAITTAWSPTEYIMMSGGVVAAIVLIILANRLYLNKRSVQWPIMVLVGAFGVYHLVEWHYVTGIFMPSAVAPDGPDAYIPHFLKLDGQWMRLPNWSHQLRDAYLWSGFGAVCLSVFNYLKWSNRGNLILAANAVLPLLFLLSPVLFTFLTGIVPVEGIYRIHLLLFTPLIFAQTLVGLFDQVKLGNLYG